MTESEAIKIIGEVPVSLNYESSLGKIREAYDVVKKSIEEIQAYRAIGTIEEFKALKEKSVPKETVENDAYLWSCKCPNCGKKIHRDSEERTFFCEQCGIQLHQRAFTEKELDAASFDRKMDEYED